MTSRNDEEAVLAAINTLDTKLSSELKVLRELLLEKINSEKIELQTFIFALSTSITELNTKSTSSFNELKNELSKIEEKLGK